MGDRQREAESLIKVLKATIAGGLLFLLPLVLCCAPSEPRSAVRRKSSWSNLRIPDIG
jgi:hypothetical protein